MNNLILSIYISCSHKQSMYTLKGKWGVTFGVMGYVIRRDGPYAGHISLYLNQ